jgi:hypothetical protein
MFPTAVQALAERHETPQSSLLPEAGPSLGLGTTDHLVPSQDSTRVLNWPPLRPPNDPTAVQALAEVHETPLNAFPGGTPFTTPWR